MFRIFLAFLLLGCFYIQAQDKPNVLFIAVDDLRPELNCYGADYMKTPHMDRLAERSMLFNNAYTQQAVCAPSRNTILTGLRPDALGIYDLYTFFRKKSPDVVTLPQHFKNNGYVSEAVGKLYHTGHGNSDDSLSWSNPKINTNKLRNEIPKLNNGDTVDLQSDFPLIDGKKLPYYCSDAPEEQMTDAITTKVALDHLDHLQGKNFFLAVGYVKPHLPFVAPRKYWDMYNPDEIEIPERNDPEGMPSVALHSFGELRKYHNIPSVKESKYLNDEMSRNLIHGYRASVSMIDAQIGRLLDKLDELELSDNTIIVLWGDHGWKLGEYGGWCKHTNFELDTRVPLMISAPELLQGKKTASLAELVDVYPTLCDLAGITKPKHLEGQSLAPILKDEEVQVNKVAISQYPRGKSLGYDRKNELMGYSVFDGKYRFVRWQSYEDPKKVLYRELYDHTANREATRNLADDVSFSSIVQKLEGLMDKELNKYKLLKSEPTK
ncbi:MAG: sulfatase [Cyclobacteriaceae bacterium]